MSWINQKEQRGGAKKKVSPRIATIHKESVRVVTNRTAKKKEFNYTSIYLENLNIV